MTAPRYAGLSFLENAGGARKRVERLFESVRKDSRKERGETAGKWGEQSAGATEGKGGMRVGAVRKGALIFVGEEDTDSAPKCLRNALKPQKCRKFPGRRENPQDFPAPTVQWVFAEKYY